MGTSFKNKIHFGRVYFLVAGLLLLWVFLEFRLYQIQIKNNEFYEEQSNRQVEKKITIPASRGLILDRNTEILATNLIHYDLGVDLNLLQNKSGLINVFSKTFGHGQSYYSQKLNQESDFVYLLRKVSEQKVGELNSFNEPGLVKLKNFRRYYPFSNYGSQVVGFTDVDDRGASGIELQYEHLLSGKNGWTILQVDAKRRFSYSAEHPIFAPERGADIYLTIDKNYQTILEDNLKTGVEKFNARSGMAILMQPKTSEILAMCNYPGYNPNRPSLSRPEFRKNRTISDVFEPGSTFKLFPIAAMLQEGIKKPDDIIYCENGYYKYFDHVVRDSKKHGWLTLKKVFEKSSNIGMVKLVNELPKHILYRYLKSFNFGSLPGIGLTGENAGFLAKPNTFSGISKGMISHGYEVGSTALQITNAYCSIVNGGYLMRPFIIRKIENSLGEILEENNPEKIRQVISEEVAEVLKKFMIGAVKNGTGKLAQIDGIEVGGKTGTAQKYDENKKEYKKGDYLASFIGFAPYENPEFVLSVFLDSPKPKYYGGETAAPVFKEMMEHLLKVNSGRKEILDEQLIITATETDAIPNVAGLQFSVASEILNARNIDFDTKGDGEQVKSQKSIDDELVLELGDQTINFTKMPDLKGLSVREALKKIDFSKLRVTIEGQGRVKHQNIKSGTQLNKYQYLVLSCSPN